MYSDLIARLRNYDQCNDSDVDQAAIAIEELTKTLQRVSSILQLEFPKKVYLANFSFIDDTLNKFTTAVPTTASEEA